MHVIVCEQVARHNTREDCFVIVHGQVYDATPYMDLHPGGSEFLMRNAGADATAVRIPFV